MAYWRGSETPLAKETEWISQVGMRDRHDTVAGAVFTDKAGELFVEQSADGKNWDISEKLTVEASKTKTINTILLWPYWRLRFKSGAEAQGAFRLSANTQASGDS